MNTPSKSIRRPYFITIILASWPLLVGDPARAQPTPPLPAPPNLPPSDSLPRTPGPKLIPPLEDKSVKLKWVADLQLAQNQVTAQHVTLLDDRKSPNSKTDQDVMHYSQIKEGGDRFGRTLVVPLAAPDPKVLSEIEEDLNVMAHLLEKTMNVNKESGHFRAAGIDLLFSPSSASAVRNLYVAGHGALFLFPSPIPLKPDQAEGNEPKTESATSSAWDQARRELYRGPEGKWYESRDSGRKSSAPKETYDAGNLERLQSTLIESLKEAANMRHVQPEETVTVVLSHDDRPGGPLAFTRHVIRQSGAYRLLSEDQAPEQVNQATLLLRAVKSDIDAFASGKTTLEQFKEKVVQILY